ncbi:hypothetical protein EJB05_25400, partial [Eragrostis curvula]
MVAGSSPTLIDLFVRRAAADDQQRCLVYYLHATLSYLRPEAIRLPSSCFPGGNHHNLADPLGREAFPQAGCYLFWIVSQKISTGLLSDMEDDYT